MHQDIDSNIAMRMKISSRRFILSHGYLGHVLDINIVFYWKKC